MAKKKFYAVARGDKTGVYTDPEDARKTLTIIHLQGARHLLTSLWLLHICIFTKIILLQ